MLLDPCGQIISFLIFFTELKDCSDMSDLSELIEIAKNIEKQNTEIIRLLKKIAGETEEDEKILRYKELLSYTPDFGDFDTPKETIEKKVENTFKIGSLLENSVLVGEVYFVEDGDIFRLSVKNNETSIDNLTGDNMPNSFNLQESIATESIKNNLSLDDNSVILSKDQSQNLAESLRICVEQGAEKVYLPIYASAQLVSAPQILMDILTLDFYKSEEELIEKLFNN